MNVPTSLETVLPMLLVLAYAIFRTRPGDKELRYWTILFWIAAVWFVLGSAAIVYTSF